MKKLVFSVVVLVTIMAGCGGSNSTNNRTVVCNDILDSNYQLTDDNPVVFTEYDKDYATLTAGETTVKFDFNKRFEYEEADVYSSSVRNDNFIITDEIFGISAMYVGVNSETFYFDDCHVQ